MREKRTRGQDKTEPLFDYKLDSFDPKKPLTADVEGVTDATLSSLAPKEKSDEAVCIPNDQRENSPDVAAYNPPLTISKTDPLNPEVFTGHHRRMEREERRMQVQERQQLIVMASKIRNQKEILSRPDWKNSIERIVRIRDVSDSLELKRKRELALQEMETFLVKFEEYNKRCNRRDSKSSGHDSTHKSKTPPKDSKVSKPKSKPKPKQPSAASSSSTSSTNKSNNTSTQKPLAGDSDPDHLFISIRPTAFGYMVPPRIFPPREFGLSSLLISEVESFDLVEELNKKRSEH